MMVLTGTLAAAEKKLAMPRMTNTSTRVTTEGIHCWSSRPTAPPRVPPMTMLGPNTPPDPPEPMVSEVVRIFPIPMAPSTTTAPRRL